MFTQHKMLAYRNGKSAGRTADTNWHGPHRFTGSYHVVPVKRACVLHFESCTYEQVCGAVLCVARVFECLLACSQLGSCRLAAGQLQPLPLSGIW